MAGDWIKMRVSLRGDPAVKGIARRTQLNRYDVIGRLHAVWSWADQQLGNGNAVGVTASDLDEEAEHPGFAQAMADEGWLRILSTGLTFPYFDRHNGKPAKDRALTGKRVKRHRNDDAVNNTVTEPLPEKRREEPISNISTVANSTEGKSELSGGRNPATAQPMIGSTTPPNARRRIKRTQDQIAEQREAGTKATPMPEHLRKGFVKPTNGNGIDHDPPPTPFEDLPDLEPPPDPTPARAPPPADEDDDNPELDSQAKHLGMQRLQFETDDELRVRLQARRALG